MAGGLELQHVEEICFLSMCVGSQAPTLTQAGHHCRGTAEAHTLDASCKELLIKQSFINVHITIFYQDCFLSYLIINLSLLHVCVCVCVHC